MWVIYNNQLPQAYLIICYGTVQSRIFIPVFECFVVVMKSCCFACPGFRCEKSGVAGPFAPRTISFADKLDKRGKGCRIRCFGHGAFTSGGDWAGFFLCKFEVTEVNEKR